MHRDPYGHKHSIRAGGKLPIEDTLKVVVTATLMSPILIYISTCVGACQARYATAAQ